MLNTQWVEILPKEKVLTYADVPILFTGMPQFTLLKKRGRENHVNRGSHCSDLDLNGLLTRRNF